MRLRDWRDSQKPKVTLDQLAIALGLDNARSAATVQRWETGESRPDADMIARIEKCTEGCVTSQDMHLTRLEWLNARKARAA